LRRRLGKAGSRDLSELPRSPFEVKYRKVLKFCKRSIADQDVAFLER